MSASNEIARLERVIRDLSDAVAADLRSKEFRPADRLSIRAAIDTAVEKLGDIRSHLAG